MPVTIGGSGPITGVTSINTSVSDTELGYLDGVTSALQSQLAGKADTTGNGAWTSFSPTFSGGSWAIGNGSYSSSTKYIQIGKLVVFRGAFTFGSTTVKDSSTGLAMSLPVAAATTDPIAGGAGFLDSGVANYAGTVAFQSTTAFAPQEFAVSGSKITYGGLTTNAPFTWAANDVIRWFIVYEAA